MSAYPILARAVDEIYRAEEQKLSLIRNAIMKAITANELEWQRERARLLNKKSPNWCAVERCDREFCGVAKELRRALDTVTLEACTSFRWIVFTALFAGRPLLNSSPLQPKHSARGIRPRLAMRTNTKKRVHGIVDIASDFVSRQRHNHRSF
jgi:hypothetical protein